MGSFIYLIFGFIEFVLGLRFVFLLIGADSSNTFVSWIYNVSHPLVVPFIGILGDPSISYAGITSSQFEVATLIALLVYGLIGAILMRILSGGRRG